MNPGKQKKNHMATSTARLPGAFFFGSPTVAVLVSVLKYRVAVIAGELPPARLDDLGVAIGGFRRRRCSVERCSVERWSVAAWSVGAWSVGPWPTCESYGAVEVQVQPVSLPRI